MTNGTTLSCPFAVMLPKIISSLSVLHVNSTLEVSIQQLNPWLASLPMLWQRWMTVTFKKTPRVIIMICWYQHHHGGQESSQTVILGNNGRWQLLCYLKRKPNTHHFYINTTIHATPCRQRKSISTRSCHKKNYTTEGGRNRSNNRVSSVDPYIFQYTICKLLHV